MVLDLIGKPSLLISCVKFYCGACKDSSVDLDLNLKFSSNKGEKGCKEGGQSQRLIVKMPKTQNGLITFNQSGTNKNLLEPKKTSQNSDKKVT